MLCPGCQALAYCENLLLAGHGNLRLPNVRELQPIVDYGRQSPARNPVFGALPVACWSSTPSTTPGSACHINLTGGSVTIACWSSLQFVRAAR